MDSTLIQEVEEAFGGAHEVVRFAFFGEDALEAASFGIAQDFADGTGFDPHRSIVPATLDCLSLRRVPILRRARVSPSRSQGPGRRRRGSACRRCASRHSSGKAFIAVLIVVIANWPWKQLDQTIVVDELLQILEVRLSRPPPPGCGG